VGFAASGPVITAAVRRLVARGSLAIAVQALIALDPTGRP